MADTRSVNYGAYVPTTSVWDPSQILSVDVTSPEFKQLLVRLYQNLNLMANVLNVKDTGFYDVNEYVNGQMFFPSTSASSGSQLRAPARNVFRKVFNFGALPNASTKTLAHGITITSGVTFTRIYGTATNPSTQFIPLPYASPMAANNIELFVDATNINVITGSNRSSFTTTYIVLEYLKS